jgi:hypothetical protein
VSQVTADGQPAVSAEHVASIIGRFMTILKRPVAFNVHTIAISSIKQLFITFQPLTQHVSAVNGHLQVFNYVKSIMLHFVLFNPSLCLDHFVLKMFPLV